MYSINKQALELVRDELQAEMESLVARFDQSSPVGDMEPLLQGLTHINGVFSLLQVVGGSVLATETIELLKTPVEVDGLPEKHWEAAANAIKLLPSYFQLIQSLGYDNPLILLTEINELRQCRGEALRDEYFFLSDRLPEKPVVSLLMSKDADQLEVIRLARHLFQKGLIHAVRGNGRKAAVKIMAHGIHRLRKVMTDESELLYWSMVFEVLGALYRGVLGFEQTRLRSLMAIERQLKMLTENASHEKSYPEAHQRAMATHFLLSGCGTESAEKLRDRLGLESLGFSAKEIANLRAQMVANGGANFHETMLVLSDKYDELSFNLDELVLNPEENQEYRKQLQDGFKNTSEICLMLGLSQVGQRCSQHTEALNQTPPADAVSDELIDEMVNTLLYLDSVVVELRDQSPTEKELYDINQKSLKGIVESNVVNHAERRVIQEALINLAEVMRVSGDFCDGMADDGLGGDDNGESIIDNFRAIVGSVDILGLDRATAVAKRCLNYFEQHFGESQDGVPEALMDVFADAVVSLEYYLDNRRWDPSFDDSVLSVAEGCLSRLES